MGMPGDGTPLTLTAAAAKWEPALARVAELLLANAAAAGLPALTRRDIWQQQAAHGLLSM